MAFWKTFGEGLLNTLTGGLFGIGSKKVEQSMDFEQQQKLMGLQQQHSKELTAYNYDKQMEMWKNTNYSAQKEELKKAGLNPGLLYGMSGGGGTTTGSGSGASMSAPSPGSGGQVMGMALGMAKQREELELLKAQRENIEADTAKKKEEVPNIQQDTRTKELINNLKQETFIADKMKNHYETNQAMHEAAIKWVDQLVAENTWGNKLLGSDVEVQKAQQEVANLYLQGIKTKEDTKLTQAQVDQVRQNIENSIKQLQQGDRALDQKDQDILIDQTRNKLIELGIWTGAASNMAGDLIKIYTGGKGGKK